ncbi:hypothetical protein P872_09390 [Rhodonellum psychrophilum GCM71 = DSM 17998]|uniref:DUF4842 domain-containing protein n=2 Tax=Rhodonellum TaxID=336827 RepID=U5BU79_9BACT|nr:MULTISPECIES: LruC domain-containing protein [Rhodonellum]ERM81423.1 hypothetical protein P872_09390 [Rhodonellum psychrophilum GCM71 = DSM 17998]SDZ56284.1 LruC domain-containing protein [Rhodonellum ikkaensis]
MVLRKGYLLVLMVLMAMTSCQIHENQSDTNPNEVLEGYSGIKPPDGFDFSTSKNVDLEIRSFLRVNVPLGKITYSIYDGNPFDNGNFIQSIYLDNNGVGTTTLSLPSSLEKIWLATDFIGAVPLVVVPVVGSKIIHKIDASNPEAIAAQEANLNSSYLRLSSVTEDFSTLGTWDKNGRPEYFSQSDLINAEFLRRVTANLPERSDVRKHNPEILSNKYKRQLFLNEDAEVWITFVHNGAGYKNAVGYYYYKNGQEPKIPADIKNLTIIYPNISALKSGDKVKLKGDLPGGGFSKDTNVGWFLIADGWKGVLTKGNAVIYSQAELNSIVKDPNLREHMVFLYDQTERVLLMGWEDLLRDKSSCDHDFNDVVFYAKWNPITGVSIADYAPVGNNNSKDSDLDGVDDILDLYPNDKDRAFDNFSPGKGVFGTLMFEDLWPSYGDFDMNDLVLGYNVKEITNSNNLIKELELKVVIRATGANNKNGFGIEFPISPESVEKVTGYRHSEGYIKTLSNGLESGQRTSSLIVFDNANFKMPGMANVFLSERNHDKEDTLVVKMIFKNALSRKELGSFPYNPFMIIGNGERGKEVHLLGGKPTDLADIKIFRSNKDRTDPNRGVYYKSVDGLNWGLYVPKTISHVVEGVDFSKGYLKFRNWAVSGGLTNQDWFENNGENLNKSLLYSK